MNQLDNRIANKLPAAPPLDAEQPNGTFVRDALKLAVAAANRGNPAGANNALRTANQQLELIPTEDPQRAYWAGQLQEVTAYVDARSAPLTAKQLAASAQQSDGEYVRNQKLRPDELLALQEDNADTADALDAERRGEDPTLVYATSTARRSVAKASAAAANVLAAGLGPWKLGIALALGVAAVLVGGYLYFQTKTAQTVAGSVTS